MKNTDIMITCKDCGESFLFPGEITVQDLVAQGTDELEAQLLLELRGQVQKDMIQQDIPEERRQALQRRYYVIEQIIVKKSNGYSQEDFNARGSEMRPARCPECREKRREQRSR